MAAGRPADGLAHLDRAIAAFASDEPGVGFYLPTVAASRMPFRPATGTTRGSIMRVGCTFDLWVDDLPTCAVELRRDEVWNLQIPMIADTDSD